jgi:nitrile hydratase
MLLTTRMNGVHAIAGMHGMGPIERQKNEPAFHARWERRFFSIVWLEGKGRLAMT